MLNKFTSIFGDENVNISNLLNKSKRNNAYTIIDIDGEYSSAAIDKIKEIEGVLKIRTF